MEEIWVISVFPEVVSLDQEIPENLQTCEQAYLPILHSVLLH